MCGLFAGTGKLNATRITALGSMNESRGADSVGLAWVEKHMEESRNRVMVAKVAERPCAALNLTLRREVTEAALSGLFIGHTRQATQGAVNSENAHPFADGEIVFAHNGIISNDKKFGKYAVDSQALIHGIRKRDFSEYEGSIALVWIEEGVLHAFRHDNPLWRGRIGATVYLASEEEQLQAIGCEHVKELAEDQVYTFRPGAAPEVKRVPVNHSVAAHTWGRCGWEDYLDRIAWRKTDKGEWIKDIDAGYGAAQTERESFSTYKDERAALAAASESEGEQCGRCGHTDLMEDWCLNCGFHPDGQEADQETLRVARAIRRA